MYAQSVLTALIAWPGLAAGVVLGAPERWAKHLALAASFIEFGVSVPLWWVFQPAGGMQLQLDVPWIPNWGIHYAVGVDGISLFMILLTTFLVPLSILGSYNYITTRERAFYALMLVLTSGMIGVFVALDLFLFYVMWDVMLIPMYFIIGVWGGQNRLYAAIKFFIYTFFGSLLMLVAILTLVYLVAQRTGVYSFSYVNVMNNIGALGPVAFWLFGAFFLAFAIKVPMFPFHTWLPDAHVEAPTAGSVILAAVLLKMGTYGFLRFAVPFFPQVALHPAVQGAIVTLSLNGFVGEFLVLLGAFRTYPVAAAVATIGVIVAAMYLLPALQRVIYNPLDQPENAHLADLSPRELAVLLPLVACIVWIGVYPTPFLRWQAARAVGIAAMIAVDDFRFVADWLFLGTAALTVLVSFEYLEREALLVPEYFALLLFATLGMMLMAGAQDLMVLFLGLELMSISVYVLAGINRRSAAAAEAALKYFLLGAFASGFLLYGIALVNGATATTNLTLIGVQVATLGLQHN